jgi:Holliday junction resolvase
MPNKNYIKGRNRENYIKRKYQKQGFACIRSSGSKGAVDVIAIKKGAFCDKVGGHCPIIHAIQCKPRNHKLARKEKEKMKAWTETTGLEVGVE